MIALTSLFLLYLFKFKPLRARIDQLLHILNTLCLLVLYLLSACFWLFNAQAKLRTRDSLGHTFIREVLVLFSINLVFITFSFLSICLSVCSKKEDKYREEPVLRSSESIIKTSQMEKTHLEEDELMSRTKWG